METPNYMGVALRDCEDYWIRSISFGDVTFQVHCHILGGIPRSSDQSARDKLWDQGDCNEVEYARLGISILRFWMLNSLTAGQSRT